MMHDMLQGMLGGIAFTALVAVELAALCAIIWGVRTFVRWLRDG